LARNSFKAEQSSSVQFIYLSNSVAMMGFKSFSFFMSNGLADFKWIAMVDILAMALLDA
jgi:hypothetical protein